MDPGLERDYEGKTLFVALTFIFQMDPDVAIQLIGPTLHYGALGKKVELWRLVIKKRIKLAWHMLGSSTFYDSSFFCYNKSVGEFVGSRPIWCTGNLPIKRKKKSWQNYPE